MTSKEAQERRALIRARQLNRTLSEARRRYLTDLREMRERMAADPAYSQYSSLIWAAGDVGEEIKKGE